VYRQLWPAHDQGQPEIEPAPSSQRPSFERREHKTRSGNVEATEWEETQRGRDVAVSLEAANVAAAALDATVEITPPAEAIQYRFLFHSLSMNLDSNVDDEERAVQFWFRFESSADETLAYRIARGYVRVGKVVSETNSFSDAYLVGSRATSDYGWISMQGVTKEALSDVEVYLVVHYGRPDGGPWFAMDCLIQPQQSAWFPVGWPSNWVWRQKREVTHKPIGSVPAEIAEDMQKKPILAADPEAPLVPEGTRSVAESLRVDWSKKATPFFRAMSAPAPVPNFSWQIEKFASIERRYDGSDVAIAEIYQWIE
jgi:hypothetical protein